MHVGNRERWDILDSLLGRFLGKSVSAELIIHTMYTHTHTHAHTRARACVCVCVYIYICTLSHKQYRTLF